jgi:hypothetical protein
MSLVAGDAAPSATIWLASSKSLPLRSSTLIPVWAVKSLTIASAVSAVMLVIVVVSVTHCWGLHRRALESSRRELPDNGQLVILPDPTAQASGCRADPASS